MVITEDGCKEAGTITHEGARGNGFVACEVDEDDEDDSDNDNNNDDDNDDDDDSR